MKRNGEPHCFVQRQVVVGAGAVGTERDAQAVAAHRRQRHDAGADLQIAFGVVHHGHAAFGEERDVFFVDPDRVRARKTRREQAESLHVAHHRRSVALLCDARLDLGLEQMRVHAEASAAR